MPLTQNRTKWPVTGGAIALQPGWFSGHQTAFFYINMGFDTEPKNLSFPMLPVFQITGPSREPYPGTFCLPQVPLPVNASVKVGDNATIQVIETAIHGASLFNVSFFAGSSSAISGTARLTRGPHHLPVRRYHVRGPGRRGRGQ